MLTTGILAYVGPGAGFALVSSFFTVAITFLLSLLVVILYPFTWVIHRIRFAATREKRMTRRVVVLGLDGLDPNVMEEMIAAGELPNLAALPWRARLGTVPPPLSPVAWSSFATGCYPGHHRVFDFVHCNPRNYQPFLSSADIAGPSRLLKLGKYQFPLGAGRMKGLWKGEHFWDTLGCFGVSSTVMRVPITFPAKIRRGHLLSGMCVPDLLGSQGVSTLFTTEPSGAKDEEESRAIRVELRNGVAMLPLTGPADPCRRDGQPTSITLKFTLGADRKSGTLTVAGKKVRMTQGAHTEWVPIDFPGAMGAISGMCRFYLTQVEPHLKLYATAIHIDPSKPALPVSNPTTFGIYLAKLLGRFGTLGIIEDTSAYETGAIDSNGMAEQCWLAHQEREKQFFHVLSARRDGLIVCVFDTPDRVQHMFWREHEAGDKTIRDMYRRMDDLVARTKKAIGDDTVLFVMSDHGFNAFRRQVNVNSWLREKGYVVRKKDIAPDDDPLWLRGMDMTKTLAFGFGLAGIHINRKSFFAGGILSDAQAAKVKAGIIRDLESLVDPITGEKPVAKAQDAAEIYKNSPYADAAPDIIVGWRTGYRVSWESAKGQCLGPVCGDNTRHWSGDHCFYPPMVPGVLLSTLPLNSESPRIVDVAPTIMRLLGVESSAPIDGRPLIGGQPDQPPLDAGMPEPVVPAVEEVTHAGV